MNKEHLEVLQALHVDRRDHTYLLEWCFEYNHDPVLDVQQHCEDPLEASLGDDGDGVRFSLEYQPTCYRRGPWRLLVSVNSGPGHFLWGCFDDADQPLRNYHSREAALSEADALAAVLISDRVLLGPTGEEEPAETGESEADEPTDDEPNGAD